MAKYKSIRHIMWLFAPSGFDSIEVEASPIKSAPSFVIHKYRGMWQADHRCGAVVIRHRLKTICENMAREFQALRHAKFSAMLQPSDHFLSYCREVYHTEYFISFKSYLDLLSK